MPVSRIYEYRWATGFSETSRGTVSFTVHSVDVPIAPLPPNR